MLRHTPSSVRFFPMDEVKRDGLLYDPIDNHTHHRPSKPRLQLSLSEKDQKLSLYKRSPNEQTQVQTLNTRNTNPTPIGLDDIVQRGTAQHDFLLLLKPS